MDNDKSFPAEASGGLIETLDEAIARAEGVASRLGDCMAGADVGEIFCILNKLRIMLVAHARPAPSAEKALRVCGNCEYGKGTSLDDTRCYKSVPYLPTGRHCAGCADWKQAIVIANPFTHEAPKEADPYVGHSQSCALRQGIYKCTCPKEAEHE